MTRILALSSSRAGNGGYLESGAPLIRDFLEKETRAAFIPFASVDRDYDSYGAMVRQALDHLGIAIEVVSGEHAKRQLTQADMIMVGGGNTFKLLHDLQEHDLMETITEQVHGGKPYIGWSAGANITGLTIGTTNDMPIIQPANFSCLAFFPFQINPHYLSRNPEGFHGETRDQRLIEFVKMNPGVAVVGLPEGTALRRLGDQLKYIGHEPGVLFLEDDHGKPVKTIIEGGADISFLVEGLSGSTD